MEAEPQFLLSYRLRTVRIGLHTTWALLAVLVALVFLPDHDIDRSAFVALVGVEIGGAIALTLLPWQRIFESGRGIVWQLAWASSNVVLITLVVATSGGGRSDFYILYALTTTYSAVAFPLRTQARFGVFTAAVYLTAVGVTGWHVSAADLFLRIGTLGVLAFLTGFLSRELSRRLDSLQQMAAENEHLALHDTLTGLPNRTLFHDRVDRALAAARREGSIGGVMVIDLDRFKEVNDSLGHPIGDALLREVGPRLAGCLRESDTLARLGGDEFAVLLPSVQDAAAGLDVGERIAAALVQPFLVEGITLDLEASVGVALFPEHGETTDLLLRHADVALYAAKELRSGCELYGGHDQVSGTRRLELLGDLRRALEAGQLILHYQPKVDLQTGRLRGVEALVRWEHPERGLVPPDEFIPLVEQTGLIGPLTLYVLDDALRQARAWQDVGLPLTVGVNVSVRNLHDPRFPAQVHELLRRWRVPPGRLELELTESTIMAHPTRALDVLLQLAGFGVGLVLDDFGTGYSSLAQLRQLPVTEIKIDKSFVLAMDGSESDDVLVRSMIDIGRNLGLRVVAEGVETEATWDRLVDLGCDVAQGYYLTRPVPPADLDRWRADWHTRSAATAA